MNGPYEAVLVAVATLGAGSGLGGVAVGLLSYLKARDLARQQADIESDLARVQGAIAAEIESLKLANEKTRFSHERQFGKEFAIYETLWGHLRELLDAASALLDPLRDLDSTEKPGTDWVKLSRDKFQQAANATIAIMRESAPFMHRDVENLIEEFISLCADSWLQDEFPNLAALGRTTQEINEDTLKEKLQQIRGAIRWRVGLADEIKVDGPMPNYI